MLFCLKKGYNFSVLTPFDGLFQTHPDSFQTNFSGTAGGFSRRDLFLVCWSPQKMVKRTQKSSPNPLKSIQVESGYYSNFPSLFC